MGTNTYPVPSSGSSTSTVLPVNASSVLLDGALTSATSYTTTINGNGGLAYLVAGDNPAVFTVGGNSYTVLPNTVATTAAAVGSSTSATVSAVAKVPTSWTSSSLNGTSCNLVGYGNGYFVAVDGSYGGGTGSVRTSTTGTGTWTSTGATVAYGTTLANNGSGTWITFTYNGSSGNISTNNGSSWSSISLPASQVWNSICYGNGYWFAVGNANTYIYSTNGTTWTSGTFPNGTTGFTCAFGGGYFVVLVASYGYYGTLPTSLTTVNHSINSVPANLTYGNGLFVASSNGSSYGYIWPLSTVIVGGGPSALGTQVLSNSAINGTSMLYANGYFWWAYGYTGSGTTPLYSTNGYTWSLSTALPAGSPSGIAYGNGTYVVVTSSTTTAYYSQAAALPVSFGIYAGPTAIH